MENTFEQYLEMARAAIPLRKKQQSNIEEFADYLEVTIDKHLEKVDNDTMEYTNLKIGKALEKYGFESDSYHRDLQPVIKILNKRYKPAGFRIDLANQFEFDPKNATLVIEKI